MVTIYEAGIIKDGLPAFRISLVKPEELINHNPLLITGFIQVLNDFIDINFDDVPEKLQMKKFSAYFHPIVDVQDKNNHVILYAFCSSMVKYELVKSVFIKIEKRLRSEIQQLLDKNVKTENVEESIHRSERIMYNEFSNIERDHFFTDKLSKF